MKEIGSELEQARQTMGVSIEEAASDLKLKPSQLENIEQGIRGAFKDVFELKQIIRDYAKYLSLEYEKLEDNFNEFVFEYTSKIPLDEIAKANEAKQQEKREIISPYTIDYKRKFSFFWFALIIILLLVVSVIIFYSLNKNNEEESIAINNTDYLLKESD